MKEFKINEFLALKLEEGKTNIYIAGEPYDVPKFLMFNIEYTYLRPNPKSYTEDIETPSIDNVIEELGWVDYPEPPHQHCVGEGYEIKYDISPETEFFGHCSNLQVWWEHNYDTSLLHTPIAFPLLRKLAEKGDLIAKKVYSGEIIKKFERGDRMAINYLCYGNYYRDLNSEETATLLTVLKDFDLDAGGVHEFLADFIDKAKGTALFRDNFLLIMDSLNHNYGLWLDVLIDRISGTKLIEENLFDILKALEKIGDDIIIPYDYFRMPFKRLLNSIKGTKLIIESFGDILHIFEKGFDYPEGLFLLFLEALKEGNVLQTIFPDLLKFLETTKMYDYHLDLINGIKGTKLLHSNYDRIMNLVDHTELIRYDGIECIGIEYFSKLVTEIKETEIIEIHYTKIRERFQSILIGIKEYLKDYDEIYEEDIGFFYNLISAIKGTELLGEFFLGILHLFDDFYSHEELDASKLFIKFTHIVLEDPAFESNFRDILSSLERMPNYYKKKATSKLIELMKGTDLLKEYFPNFAYLNEIIDQKYYNGSNFTAYVDAINRIDSKDTTLIEILVSHIIRIIENSYVSEENELDLPDFLSRLKNLNDNYLIMKIFAKVFEKIKEHNLLNKNLVEILNFLEKTDTTYKKKKIFYILLDEINKKGLLKQNINPILSGISFHNYNEFYFELNEFLSFFQDHEWDWDYFRELDKFSNGLNIPSALDPRFSVDNDEVNFYFFAKLFYLAKDTSLMEYLFIYILDNYEKLGIDEKIYNFSDFTLMISNSTFFTKYFNLIEHRFLEILKSLKEERVDLEYKQHLFSTLIMYAKRTPLLERNGAFITEIFPEFLDEIK